MQDLKMMSLYYLFKQQEMQIHSLLQTHPVKKTGKTIIKRKDMKKRVTLKNMRQIVYGVVQKSREVKGKPLTFRKKRNDAFRRNLKDILQSDQITCPICLNYMISPFITSCGHSLCYDCAESAFRKEDKCCICRQSALFDYSFSKKMNEIILKFVEKMNPVERKNYEKRMNEFEQIEGNRLDMTIVRVGDMIDVKDQSNWVKGCVVEVCPLTVTVSSTISGCFKYKKETFSLFSRKLVRLHTFTEAVLSPTYNPNLVFGYGAQVLRLIQQPLVFRPLLSLRRQAQPIVTNEAPSDMASGWDVFEGTDNNNWALSNQELGSTVFQNYFQDISDQNWLI